MGKQKQDRVSAVNGNEEDTIGPARVQRSVGGDGTDRQHGHADDEVGHQEHGDALVQSRMSHHKA